MLKAIGILAAALLVAGAANATVVENFETGTFGPGWVGSGGTVTAPGINVGGTSGYAGSTNGSWYWRSDAGSYIGPNTIIRFTIVSRPGSTGLNPGVAVGFGPDAQHFSYWGVGGFKNSVNGVVTSVGSTIAVAGVTSNFTPGQKYIMEIDFGPTIVVGAPHALNAISAPQYSPTAGLLYGATGFFGMFSPSGTRFDNVEILNPGTPPSPVPEPAAWALMIIGMGLTGAMTRRRRLRLA